MHKQSWKDNTAPIRQILAVDNEKNFITGLALTLSRAGYVCKKMGEAKTALAFLAAEEGKNIDLIIAGMSLPDMDGIAFLRTVKNRFADISVMVVTDHGTAYTCRDIMDAGAADIVSRPLDSDCVLARISRIAREKHHLMHLQQKNVQLSASLDQATVLAKESQSASRAKTFFLASMSHEIRTPLNSIVGYTDMMLDTPLNEDQRSFLHAARLSCDTLLSVVNDILDFSKVTAGKLHMETIDFDPEILCFETIEQIRSQVDETRVELLCQISDQVPAQVAGDPHRFRQILLNFLGNAVKFTDKGSISLHLNGEDRPDNHCLLTVSVTDTGIGIAPDELDTIFEPFIQSESDIVRRSGGTGLGLAISKNIAEKMQGTVWATSVSGKGSTFYFSACLKKTNKEKTSRILQIPLAGKKILLSTTTAESQDILTRELTLAGMKPVHHPLKHLDTFLKNHRQTVFDICIVDFGTTLCRSFPGQPRILEGLHPEQYPFGCIACSVPFPGIAAIFEQKGFKGFLPKPIRKSSLLEMMAHVMGRHISFDTVLDMTPEKIITVHSLAENKKHGTSILLVEDNPVNRKMTSLMLTKAGYTVVTAANGKEAVHIYTQSIHRFDLILMDINMPVMDGCEAARRIRTHEGRNASLGRIPIMALTAGVLDDFKAGCMAAGMDDFLTKPIKRDLVFQAIQKWAF